MTTLPDKARRKLFSLQQERDLAQSLVTSTVARVGDTIRAVQNNPEGPHAADMEFELTRLRAVQGKSQQKFEALSSLVSNLNRWLSQIKPNQHLVDAKPVKMKERSGESVFDAIDRVRGEISIVSSELSDVRDAGLPTDELKAQCSKYVLAQALRCTPKITASQKDFRVEWGSQTSFTNPAPEAISYLCLYDPDAVINLLCKEVDKLPIPKLTLAPADRDAQMTALKESLLRLERSEEQLIVAAEQENDQFVSRRPAADPAAVLGVVVERVTAKVVA